MPQGILLNILVGCLTYIIANTITSDYRYSASADTGFVADVTYEGEAVYPDEERFRI